MSNKINANVFWIGVDNPCGRDFHGISTTRGGSYNSYLIMDDNPTIIDATDKPFFDKYLESLRSLIDPEEVKYIVMNHAEPDHAGALDRLLEVCKHAKIICTNKCKEFLVAAFDSDDNISSREFIVVDDLEEQDGHPRFSIGKNTLKFIIDPMVHWPETMMTYLDGMLFSSDLFGTEIAHEALFAHDMKDFKKLTQDYFAIVFRPFAKPVKNAIDMIRSLKVDVLCPSHGPLYKTKDSIDNIISYYEKLASSPEEKKVTIIYSSVWHSTSKMAEEIARGINDAGVKANHFDIASSNLVSLMSEAMTSKGILLGSLTIVGGYHWLFYAMFDLLKLNNQPGKKCSAFGTYGWAPVAMRKLSERMADLKYDVMDGIELRFGPRTKDDLKRCYEFGKSFAKSIAKSIGGK